MRATMERAPRSREPIIRLVAQSRDHARLVAELHARAAEAAGASHSALLEIDASRRCLHATSGTGFDHLGDDPWLELPASVAMAYEVLASGHPRQVAPVATVLPDLACHVSTPVVILAPVSAQEQALGLLVLAVPAAVPALEWADAVTSCADAFAVALARTRADHALAVPKDADAAVADPADLERLCARLARVFAADRVTLWQHDRVVRRLEVVAASDGSHRRRPAVASTAEPDAVLVRTLRGSGVQVLPVAGQSRPTAANVAVPLRGQRRALGVLVFHGVRTGPGEWGHAVDDFARLGRQLSRVLDGRQLLDEVLRTRRDLENTFDSMRDVVIVCDRQRAVARINRAGAGRLGLDPAAAVGRPVASLTGEALSHWIERLPLGTPEQWHPQETELEDGPLRGTFRVTATPLADAHRALVGLVIVARDVTDERRAEVERAALRERLAQSEALSHLVAGIAHELNNPLQAVLGHLELLRHTAAVPPTLDGPVRQIYREADRAARIVRNLLLLAGAGRLTRRAVSVNRALKRALGLRGVVWRRARIAVHRDLDPVRPRTRGDAVLLQQAFLNILMNAEQALRGVDRPRVEVRSRTEGVTAVVEIRDNGPGIAADTLPRVFDPFFTTKDAGSGLGLALTLRILREFGGDVTAANHPDGGACFTVTLPLHPVVK
jgi:PAS domain S-box-containing protein